MIKLCIYMDEESCAQMARKADNSRALFKELRGMQISDTPPALTLGYTMLCENTEIERKLKTAPEFMKSSETVGQITWELATQHERNVLGAKYAK
jgi:hypothetical protein